MVNYFKNEPRKSAFLAIRDTKNEKEASKNRPPIFRISAKLLLMSCSSAELTILHPAR